MKRRLAMIGVFAFAFIGAVYLLTDVDTRLKPQDVAAIRSLEIKKDCEDLTTFAKELGCVRSLQAAIQDKIPDLRCATKDKTIEPKEFLQRGYIARLSETVAGVMAGSSSKACAQVSMKAGASRGEVR